MKPRTSLFYCGVFCISMCVLMLQIIQTRLLSVTSYYHLAFFAISMAMFGLTAGAVWVYLQGDRFAERTLSFDLTWSASAFAISTAVCLALQLTTTVGLVASATVLLIWAKLVFLIATPFFFAGVVISLALTRSPLPVGKVYAADLSGAAVGCLGVLLLLRLLDAPSAIFAVGALAALGAWLLSRSGIGETPSVVFPGARFLTRPLGIGLGLAALCMLNAVTLRGLHPTMVKEKLDRRGSSLLYEKWNSFSRVAAYNQGSVELRLWGPSPVRPRGPVMPAIHLNIDGEAATLMSRFDGDPAMSEFLEYDVTNLAYYARNRGRAAVIGVGSGRDVLSAYHFGFRDITGVELNPIFIDLLTRRQPFADFAGLAVLDGVRFHVDEARSWFTRTEESFDLIQMSMIDTWAATGAGAFTLSENGLYTIEGWKVFLSRLAPDGLFTVSRWYESGNINETGRLLSLAVGTLHDMDVADHRQHLFLAAADRLATLVVSRSPFSEADLEALTRAAERLEFKVLLSPRQEPATVVLEHILTARSLSELHANVADYPLDLTPPTDDRPFFFNQLRLSHLGAVKQALTSRSSGGVIHGNLVATGTLLVILLVSLVAVVAAIVIPLVASLDQVKGRLVSAGTAYFLLLGFGFMLIEIGLLQRLSVYLGHPIYALSVVLFAIILSTGIGSYLSERLSLGSRGRFLVWSGLVSAYYLSYSSWFGALAGATTGSDIGVRAALTVISIAPGGLLMGFGFPTGMRLVAALDHRPTPWFWGINGAAGVLAAGLAVALSMSFGIELTLVLGALCYLALIPAVMSLESPALDGS